MFLNSFFIILIIKILFFNIVENTSSDPDIKQFVNNANIRLSLAFGVALYKFVNHQNITDPVREKQLLDNMASKAKNISLNEDYVRSVFQDQIDANKQLQEFFVNSWNNSGKPNIKVPDLKNDIRPKIDIINDNMLISLVKIQKIAPFNYCSTKVNETVNNLIMRSNQIEEQGDALKVAVVHLCKNDCKNN
ncbi:hypothetical protein ACQ4LE_009987 [Meloidogyne hapla]